MSPTICTSCYSGYLFEHPDCVTECSSDKVSFNATSCLSECPTNYTNNSGVCTTNSTNNTNTTNTTNNTDKIVPFPYIIGYSVVGFISIGMKCMFSSTLLAPTIMSLGSLFETASIWTLGGISLVDVGIDSMQTGFYCLVVGLALIYLFNILNIVFVVCYLQRDDKFVLTYSKTKSPNIFIRIVSIIFNFKFHEIVFTNLCGVRALRNKVENTKILYPINVLLIFSLLNSILVVVGASLISYSQQG